MNATSSRLLLAGSALAVLAGSATTQQRSEVREIQIPGKDSIIRVWNQGGTPYFSISLDGQKFQSPTQTSYDLLLRYERFDPCDRERPALDETVGERRRVACYLHQPGRVT